MKFFTRLKSALSRKANHSLDTALGIDGLKEEAVADLNKQIENTKSQLVKIKDAQLEVEALYADSKKSLDALVTAVKNAYKAGDIESAKVLLIKQHSQEEICKKYEALSQSLKAKYESSLANVKKLQSSIEFKKAEVEAAAASARAARITNDFVNVAGIESADVENTSYAVKKLAKIEKDAKAKSTVAADLGGESVDKYFDESDFDLEAELAELAKECGKE